LYVHVALVVFLPSGLFCLRISVFSSMKFTQKLSKAIHSNQTVLCIGLDPLPERVPAAIRAQTSDPGEQILIFCSEIIDATSDLCAAYKPNLAFFEALGAAGLEAFGAVLDYIPKGKIVIADAKRGDIGNTAQQYRKAFMETWPCDAITLSPLMGVETLTPFLTQERFGIYVLTVTSNPGATDFLDQRLENGLTLSQLIAQKTGLLNGKFPGHAGMVTGATQTHKLPDILQYNPDGALLIPGIGVQGGRIEELRGVLQHHKGLPLVNVSRSIMYGEQTSESLSDIDEVRLHIRNRARAFYSELKPITELVTGEGLVE
jgi:orotidine-5'-phosphate decarboxylase